MPLDLNIQTQIEAHLLADGGWVSGRDLGERFGVGERALRSVGDQPGICSAFAISSDKGLKHIERASTAEWLAFKHRMRGHGIGELRRVSRLDRRRAQVLKTIKRPAFAFEKDSGQGVLI